MKSTEPIKYQTELGGVVRGYGDHRITYAHDEMSVLKKVEAFVEDSKSLLIGGQR